MPTISIDSGSINLPKHSAKVYVWHCPKVGSAAKEITLGAAARDPENKGIVTKASAWSADRPAVVDTVNGIPTARDIAQFGKFNAATFEIRSGEIIKLSISRRVPWAADQGIPLYQAATGINGNVYYRVREGAAIVTIKVKMVDDNRCPTRRATITGPLEPITMAEAEAEGMKPVVENWRKLSDRPEVLRLIETVTVQAATTAVVSAVNTKGETVITSAPARRRRHVETV